MFFIWLSLPGQVNISKLVQDMIKGQFRSGQIKSFQVIEGAKLKPLKEYQCEYFFYQVLSSLLSPIKPTLPT